MAWEFDLLYWFQSLHHPVLDQIEKLITRFGDKGLFWIALTLLMLIFVKDKRLGMTAALALVTEALICNVILKNAVQRSRPCWLDSSVELLVKSPKDYSFPSGHSSVSFAVAVSIIQYHRKWGIAAVVFAALIAISRLYLFVHFPTDVLVGTLIGTVMALISGMIVRKGVEKHPELMSWKKDK
ncbi:MAG: phosphatase PAP2 family protein [Lachnospiraceae bacterium]|nr:phosphatase PAP2 family protein [Lachnospiraceae bacterium]